MPQIATYDMPVGAQQDIPYSAKNRDGSPFDATGYTLKFRLKAKPYGGAPYLLDKTLTITTQLGAIGKIPMVSTDTLTFAPDTYYFDVTAYATVGTNEVPLTTGTFLLTERVSR